MEGQRRLAVHRTILVVDIEGFSSLTNVEQPAVRAGLYLALQGAFEKADIPWSECIHEDRGDGVFVLAPPQVPKSLFAELLPGALVEALRHYNSQTDDRMRIRLRMALNAGDVTPDGNGASGAAINLAFRLIDAPQLREALAESAGLLAVISSAYFYDDVMRHSPPCDLATFRRVRVEVKQTDSLAWICRPDDPYPPGGNRDESWEVERRYLNLVAEEHATFEMFQVARAGMPLGAPFDEYYVMPPITRRQTTGKRSELTGAGTDPVNAITDARRVLLLGGAGAGKTTFLNWMAYVAATRGQEGPWRDVVPFFLSLRHFPSARMPQRPEELLATVAPTLTGGKLAEWVDELFTKGRAMLLVDGLDELVADRRNDVKRWLERFVRTYPEARYVVSTRPSAVDDSWFLDLPGRTGLIRFELLPLSSSGLDQVIEHWYRAARTQEFDTDQQQWLSACEASLRDSLATRPNLRTLVASPLLAALLCALYRQNNQYLPRTRRELLDQSLDLLLGRWDNIKVSATDDSHHRVAVEEELQLTKAEQLILLERFAAPMVRGAELMVSRADAERRLERAMTGLRSQGLAPDRLLQHMLVRTGLLREHPAEQKIQFVHRTFRDYLAAADMVKAGELETLVENAHKDSWYEVVFMAAAQAREREVADLLQRLLRQASQTKDQRLADRLQLVAAACLGYADVVYPDQVRVDVQNAVRRLIPPTDFHEAEMLARAGRFVIELLPGPDQLTGPGKDTVSPFVIRTLAMIGGEEAWEKIRPFTAMHQSTVVDELLRGWREFDFADDYARFLLSQVDFGDRVLPVRRWDLLPRLRHLTTLTALKVIGDVALEDGRDGIYPLAALRSLRSLEIVANQTIRDLSPLARSHTLRVLRITGHSKLIDLSALAGCTVQRLTLLPVARTERDSMMDLTTLAGAPLTSLSINHPRLATGLHDLPGELPLVDLEIINRPDKRSLLGIERFTALEKVTVHGVPADAEVEALATLPALRHLVLKTPEPVGALARLWPLGRSLDVLELDGVHDPVAAEAAIGPDFEAELRIGS
ncbi:putative ATPase [Kibdelosporangium banguiense]|uniref:ATPase n=1 Tax=Kibdelosporangium banguiense TaxID=1365924 RepID=A0ABS4TKN8_9PSEU|nr:NACHT domain-containing protein [Kibdelosporangium banguiense]MBP2324951.1 putative ATPase [Kibdelosporangium banguiense]